MTIQYVPPRDWALYDAKALLQPLAGAKAAILAVTNMPFQRSWAEELQHLQLKREVAGTSRIEGAEFTDQELDAALEESPSQLHTRSQRQAAAAVSTYRWIAGLSVYQPVNADLILEVHRRIVTGCDDDHCPPGELRRSGQNVTFGTPRHRGAEGGEACNEAFDLLVQALSSALREHDPLIQALALHYHLAAMHPFLDGNGRTARAVEALMLQRLGLRDTLFIAMSNYYYEEKTAYLQALGDTRAADHDLTPFLLFALQGVERQCLRLFAEIRLNVVKALYRNTMTDLFLRLQSPRKRVMSARHVQILNLLLDEGEIAFPEITAKTRPFYSLKNPHKALIRDLNYLLALGAIKLTKLTDERRFSFSINLEWPTEITETAFFEQARNMAKGRVQGFLSG